MSSVALTVLDKIAPPGAGLLGAFGAYALWEQNAVPCEGKFGIAQECLKVLSVEFISPATALGTGAAVGTVLGACWTVYKYFSTD